MIFFKGKMKFNSACLYLIAICGIMISASTYLKSQNDTTQAAPESPVLRIPSPLHGRMFLLDSNITDNVSKRNYQFNNYTSLSDILYINAHCFPMSLGSYILFNQVSFDGAMPNGIAWANNGRNLLSTMFGTYNFEQFSPEFLESVEIFTGSKAAIFGDNSPGAFLNIQEVRHNTNKPFTKLWIAQGGSELLASDGIFSQNFHPEWNLTVGYRNLNSDGRFANNWVNLWNARILLRWSPSDSTSITFSEYFTNHGHGNSGGNNFSVEQDLYDPISTLPMFNGLNEREFRHDLNLTLSHIFPTKSTVTLVAYFSDSHHDRFSGRNYDFQYGDTTTKNYPDKSHYYGISGRYEQGIFGFIKFKTGGFIDRRYSSQSYVTAERSGISLAGFGHIEFNLSDFMILSGGMRLFTSYENIGTAIGANLKLTPDKSHSFEFDVVRANRLPHIVEGFELKNEEHYSIFADYKGNISNVLNVNLRLFGRRINDFITTKVSFNALGVPEKITFQNSEFAEIAGLYAMIDYQVSKSINIQLRAWSQPYLSGEYKDKFPLFYGGARAYYTYSPGKSILRAGMEYSISSGAKYFGYMPLTRSYYASDFDSGFLPQSLDAFLEIKIGTAYFKAAMMNLLASNYHQISLYPHLSRNFRMSLNWAFLE